MKNTQSRMAGMVVAHAIHSLRRHHLPRISRCLSMLPEREIWWRPHSSSNSIGNLVLHLSGNVRQWILSGLGGAADIRDRNQEFAERGPLHRRGLLERLRSTVREASRVIGRLQQQDLEREYVIQGFRVTGLQALLHVTEHFALHAGQIILVTKMKRQRDLGFTRLPGEKRRRTPRSHLPAV